MASKAAQTIVVPIFLPFSISSDSRYKSSSISITAFFRRSFSNSSDLEFKKYFDEEIYVEHQHIQLCDKQHKKYTCDVLGNNESIKTNISTTNYCDDYFNCCYIKHIEWHTIDESICYKILRGDTLKKITDNKYPYKLSKLYSLTNFNKSYFSPIINKRYEYIKNNYEKIQKEHIIEYFKIHPNFGLKI